MTTPVKSFCSCGEGPAIQELRVPQAMQHKLGRIGIHGITKVVGISGLYQTN